MLRVVELELSTLRRVTGNNGGTTVATTVINNEIVGSFLSLFQNTRLPGHAIRNLLSKQTSALKDTSSSY